MKKSFLICLPLLAVSLCSCRGGGRGGAVKNVVPTGGEEISLATAFDKLLDSLKSSVLNDTIGVTATANTNVKMTLNMPNSGSSDTKFTKTELSVSSKVKMDGAASGLAKKGLDNIEASLSTTGSVSYDFKTESSSLPNMSQSISLDADVYYEEAKAYASLSEDFINSLGTLISSLGSSKFDPERIPGNGKFYVSVPDEVVAYAADLNISEYLTDFLLSADIDGEKMYEYVKPYIQYFTKFVGYKYSNSQYAIYAEANVLEFLSIFMGGSTAEAFKECLDEKDDATIKAGIVFNTSTGIETAAVASNAKINITYAEVMKFAGLDDETISSFPKDVQKTVLLDAKSTISYSLSFKYGGNVKVAKLSKEEKEGFVEYKLENNSAIAMASSEEEVY